MPIADGKTNLWNYFTLEITSKIVIGIVNFWTYFKVIDSKHFFCYKIPGLDASEPKSLCNFFLFSTDNLKPLTDFNQAANKLKDGKSAFIFNTSKFLTLTIPLELQVGINNFEFPVDLKKIEEINIISKMENLYPNKKQDQFWDTFILLNLKPKTNQIEIIPLDWFNKSSPDYGYVWPARIARSKFDNKLYGQGMRMGNFILDFSGTKEIKATN